MLWCKKKQWKIFFLFFFVKIKSSNYRFWCPPPTLEHNWFYMYFLHISKNQTCICKSRSCIYPPKVFDIFSSSALDVISKYIGSIYFDLLTSKYKFHQLQMYFATLSVCGLFEKRWYNNILATLPPLREAYFLYLSLELCRTSKYLTSCYFWYTYLIPTSIWLT